MSRSFIIQIGILTLIVIISYLTFLYLNKNEIIKSDDSTVLKTVEQPQINEQIENTQISNQMLDLVYKSSDERGNIYEINSVTGTIEGSHIEIHGHMDGKIVGDDVVIGGTGTVKGDIEFANNLKTENGADIDGYIKKTNSAKSKLSADFLFSKSKDDKKSKENGGSETVVNKDSELLA